MRNTGRITLCAMLSALASVFMLTSYFPYLTYAIPAVAGLFIMIAVIEINVKWAALSFVATAIIVALTAEPEAKMLFVLFFGYYPILKAVFEKIKSRVIEYTLKFAVFNVAVIVAYGFVATLIGVDLSDMGDFGKYTSMVLLAAANVVFPIYDAAVSKMEAVYIVKLHPQISKIIKIK